MLAHRLARAAVWGVLGCAPSLVWPQAAAIGIRGASSSSTDSASPQQRMEEAAAKGDLAGVLSVVEAAGEGFEDAEAVHAALEQVARCARDMPAEELHKLHSSATFQLLADMAVGTAGGAPPGVLAHTIGVLGRLRFSDEIVLDSLAREVMAGVAELQPGELDALVAGLRRADHSPSVMLLDAVHDRLAATHQEMPAEAAHAVREGLAKLGREEGNLPNPGAQDQPDRIKYS